MKNNNKLPTRIIYTNFMADFLIMNGEQLLHTRPDLKYPDRNVFVFKNSNTFNENLEQGIILQRTMQGKDIV